jgi:hypothetical protein
MNPLIELNAYLDSVIEMGAGDIFRAQFPGGPWETGPEGAASSVASKKLISPLSDWKHGVMKMPAYNRSKISIGSKFGNPDAIRKAIGRIKGL